MGIVIYGIGAVARLLYSHARRTSEIVGFTVDDHLCTTDSFCGLPLVPFSSSQNVFSPDAHHMIVAVGYGEMNELRARKYREGLDKGYRFTSYVDPSVVRHDDVEIMENSIILDNTSIHPGCVIGRNTFIASHVSIGHDCVIDEDNWISSGVVLAGGCRIGRGCFFGISASVAHGVTLGQRNFIAANTLINRDTGDDQVYLSEPGTLYRLNSTDFMKFSRMSG